MYLGKYEDLKRRLTAVFGKDVYTDDNAVVLTDGNQEDVATLWVVRPDYVTIYRPRKKLIDIHVPGARAESSDARYWPRPVKKHARVAS